MQQPSDLRSLIAYSLRENGLPVGLIAVYIAVAFGLASHFDFGVRTNPLVSILLFGACFILISGGALLWLLARERPESPFRLAADLPRRWRLGERVALGAPVLLAAAVFFPVFSSMKTAIHIMRPYAFDPLFSQMDIWIHGRPAWEVLHPLLGYPVVSYLLNGVYQLWLGVFYMVYCGMAVFVEQPEVRRRFLIAFVLCWVLLGNLAATLWASVGPCFYGFFYGLDPYAGLMSYLHQADAVLPLVVLDIQDLLLEGWREGTPELGRGISAMPSVHVSVACLIMLLGWKLGRLWAWAGTLFLIAIVLGSVHLAYHYAVDAYASLIATPLIWWASKHLAAFRGFGSRLAVAPVAAE